MELSTLELPEFYATKRAFFDAVIAEKATFGGMPIEEARSLIDEESEERGIVAMAASAVENNLFMLMQDTEKHILIEVEILGVKVPAIGWHDENEEDSKPILLYIMVTDQKLFSSLKIHGMRV